MSRPRVLINSNEVPQVALDLLKIKCDLTILPYRQASREEVLCAIPGHDAIFLAFHEPINSEFLDVAGSKLRVISTMSAGYDHLDVPEIKKRGIKVGNTPKVLSSAVADIAIMLSLSASRRAYDGRLKLIEGNVQKSPQWHLGVDIKGSTVGLVGLGNIGQAIAVRLKGFEIEKIVYTGHGRKKAGDDLDAEFVSLDKLLEISDFVIVATPLTLETRRMFNDSTFKKMKKNAVFVNVGRGAVVDTNALVRALKDKQIFAAGLDVVDPEPLHPDHELLKLPNVEISPHLGSSTVKTRNIMAETAAQNILNALDGKPMLYPL